MKIEKNLKWSIDQKDRRVVLDSNGRPVAECIDSAIAKYFVHLANASLKKKEPR